MATDLGEDRDATVQKVFDEVIDLFKPLARRDWLAWGGDLLFSEMRDDIERERVRKEREEAREAAAVAKKAELDARKTALVEARSLVLAEFRAKTISKDDLQRRNRELAAEAKDIERNEEEVVDEEEDEEDGPVVRLGKRKAKALEAVEGEDEVDEVDEGTTELEAKRARFEATGLIDFEGPVSPRYLRSIFDYTNEHVLVRSMRWVQVPAALHRRGGGREMQTMPVWGAGMLVAGCLEERGSKARISEGWRG
jgi:hypothetical protein